MRVDPISTEVDGKICDLLISMVGKPNNFKFCKASNTYDNRYRIDIWQTLLVPKEFFGFNVK